MRTLKTPDRVFVLRRTQTDVSDVLLPHPSQSSTDDAAVWPTDQGRVRAHPVARSRLMKAEVTSSCRLA